MFEEVQRVSDGMIVEIREYLDFLSTHNPSGLSAIPRFIDTGKGLLYVQLYGVIESTVIRTLSRTLDYINEDQTKLSQLKLVILSLALNDELDAIIDSNTKKWDKRYDLFRKIDLDEVAKINNALMPTDGKNIGSKQLSSIFKIFQIDVPFFHEPSFQGRLTDIVHNRINIAHGNSTSSQIGRSLTIADLNQRIDEVSAFCSYFISTFDDYVKAKKYLIVQQTI